MTDDQDGRWTLPLATALGESYVMPLLVMLTSLRAHLDPRCEPHLYLLHTNLPDRWIARVAELVSVHPVRVDADTASRIPAHSRFPREAAYPLLLADLLPRELDAVLFLDPDLLVLDDLALLWEAARGPETVAAVPDCAIPHCGSHRGVKDCQRRGVPNAAPYFNAGVMRIDLGQWRARDVTRLALEYLAMQGKEADFLHQEALNAVLWNDWKPLDQRWNLVASLFGRPYAPPAIRTTTAPGIIHFAGRFKPWRIRTGSPLDGRYRSYLDRVAKPLPEAPPRTGRERVLEFYDRRVRNHLYPAERLLWNRRAL